jgi:protease YdgD
MWRFCKRFSIPAALLLAMFMGSTGSPSSHAETDLTPGIVGADNRAPVGSIDPPWSSIGHVNVSGYRLRRGCTGTLVAPRVVLTAAECVIDPWKREPFAPNRIFFAAGVMKDTVVGRSAALCIKFPDDYRYVGPARLTPDLPYHQVPLEHYVSGLAIIVLIDDIPDAGIYPLADGEVLHEGLALTHVAYPITSRYLLTADSACRAVRRTCREDMNTALARLLG